MTGSAAAQPADQALQLRRELAVLRAGARDLAGDYDSTIELAEHLRARRAANGQAVDVDAVLLDLEACIRSAPPLLDEVGCGARLAGAELTAAVDRARAEFDRRIREHLAFARTGLQNR